MVVMILQWITPTQIGALKDWVVAPTVGAVVWALIQRGLTSSRNKLHTIMTENANRTRDDLMNHIDAKFQQHENSAFARLDEQDRRLKDLEKQIGDLAAVLKAGWKP
jgi:Heat shock factor binding protein 1